MEVSAVKMKYMSTLISVKDMENSKKFYHDVLGLNVVADFGANVTLDGGVVLHLSKLIKSFCQTTQENSILKKMIWMLLSIILNHLI